MRNEILIDDRPGSAIPCMTFHNSKNKMIGSLDFSGEKIKFEGDAEESAKIFFDYLCDLFNIQNKKTKP